MLTFIDSALQKTYEILGSECSPIGLMASPEGYPHVSGTRQCHYLAWSSALSRTRKLPASFTADPGWAAVRAGRHPQQRQRCHWPVGSHQYRFGRFLQPSTPN